MICHLVALIYRMLDDSSEDETETMVITLGSRYIKAGYCGEKTCRYVSEEVHVLGSNSESLVQPQTGLLSSNSSPLLNVSEEVITNKTALVTALRLCWSQQYSEKLDPSETRLSLVVATTSTPLLRELARLVFEDLGVKELCVMTPGEAVTVIESKSDSIVVDIGVQETRIETFVQWRLVHRVLVRRGGQDVRDCPSQLTLKNPEVIFWDDACGNSIPESIQQGLEDYHTIQDVLVVGSTSYRFCKEYFEEKCGAVYKDRTINYILPPERNKSAWLGAAVASGVSYCQHRFHSKEAWSQDIPEYEPLVIMPP